MSHKRLGSFCDQCLSVASNQLFRLPIHRRLTDLVQASQDCSLCNIICRGLALFMSTTAPSDQSDVIITPGQFGRPMNVLCAWIVKNVSGSVAIQIFDTSSQSPFAQIFGTARDICTDSASEEFLLTVQEMAKMCQARHKSCQPINNELPKRVIDVGDLGQVTNSKLYITHGEVADYAALSHCWGSEKSYTTTTANLEDRCFRLIEADMPKTFRDAIRITRCLGLRYLWIDSLCIIQDSRDDWDKQSALMGKIYAQAHVTIAASLSTGDELGFLGPRRSHTSCLLQFSNQGVSSAINVREQLSHDDSDDLVQSDNPLFTRAWCFQELLMSPRILSFTNTELQWHCREASWCECDRWRGMSLVLDNSLLQRRRKMVQASERSNIEWCRMIEAYSALKLTLPSDRLPALSGLAQLFQPESEEKYIAGMWSDHLSVGLSWQVSMDFPGIGVLPPEYRAPSWSWASVDAPIFYKVCVPMNHGELWPTVEESDSNSQGLSTKNSDTKDSSTKDSSTKDFNATHLSTKDLRAKDPIIKLSSTKESEDWRVVSIQVEAIGWNTLGEVRKGSLTISGRIVHAILTIPAIAKGADERTIKYTISRLDEKPPNLGDYIFRPDVPLVSHTTYGPSGTLIQTARRSRLKAGEARHGFTATVWVLWNSGQIVLGLYPKYAGNGSTKFLYERIGIIQKSDFVRDTGYWSLDIPPCEITII